MTWCTGFLLTALALCMIAGWLAYRRVRAREHQLGHALAEAEHRLGQLVRYLDAVRMTARAGLLLVTEDGEIVWRSESAKHLLSPTGEEDIASLSQTFLATSLIPLVHRAFSEQRNLSRQFQCNERVYWARVQPLEGKPALTSLTVEDVTELQRLGRARRDFIANISHDLRTPITTIQLLAETLRMGAIKEAKKAGRLLDSIIDQTLTLQQMAQELMDLSMIEAGRLPLRLQPTPLLRIIEPSISRLATQIEHRSLHIQRAYDPQLTVLADEEPLQRVIQNLLHNAIKFTPEGGKIIIGAHVEGDNVVVYMRDTGPGIPSEHLDRIFERFYKADPARTGSGSGLGLAIAKHIVEGHGGRIWGESQLGEGATFFFTLLRA